MYRIARALLLVTLLLSTGASTICGMLQFEVLCRGNINQQLYG